jgi:hypothetical protein
VIVGLAVGGAIGRGAGRMCSLSAGVGIGVDGCRAGFTAGVRAEEGHGSDTGDLPN